jgi:beta-1,4-N-acetylglucosaminyltransferase
MVRKGKNVKILFPSSSGGHLAEIAQLKKLFENYEYLIVTEDLPLNRRILKDRNCTFVRPNGQNRDMVFWKNFLINWFLSIKILFQFKPDIIVTTGSHTAVPFCYLGKIMGCKIVFILSFCRIDSRAKAADLVYPIADLFFVQWEKMKAVYKKGIFAGPIF